MRSTQPFPRCRAPVAAIALIARAVPASAQQFKVAPSDPTGLPLSGAIQVDGPGGR